MTAATGDRFLQEEVAGGGNVNDIMLMLMECTQENVPIDENQAASLRLMADTEDRRCFIGTLPYEYRVIH